MFFIEPQYVRHGEYTLIDSDDDWRHGWLIVPLTAIISYVNRVTDVLVAPPLVSVHPATWPLRWPLSIAMCVQRAQEARDQHCIVDVASRPVVHRHKCARSSSDPSRLFTDMAAASAVKHRLDHSIDDLTNDERTVSAPGKMHAPDRVLASLRHIWISSGRSPLMGSWNTNALVVATYCRWSALENTSCCGMSWARKAVAQPGLWKSNWI